MGNTQTKNPISEQYEIVQELPSKQKLIKRKADAQLCLLSTIPIYGQQKYQLMERIKARLGAERPLFVTPLLSWHRKEDTNICGNREQIELIYSETTPTLAEVFKRRKQKGLEFNPSQIMYILKNIAFGLKNLQRIKEQHGKVNLNNICVSNDVLLIDSLLLQKKVDLQFKNEEIEGFPSPEKLRTLYDSLTNFEELRGDLFSLGMVCLQLYHMQLDVKALYVILDPRFSNYRLDLQLLKNLCNQVREPQLRQALFILTSLNSKDRLNIYAFLKGVAIDNQQVRLFKESSRIGTSNHSTLLQSTVKQPVSQQRLIQNDNFIFNAPTMKPILPRETVDSFISNRNTNPPISHHYNNSISFRITPNQQSYYDHLPLFQQPKPLIQSSTNFKPFRFTMLDNIPSIETSRFVNIPNSISLGNSVISSQAPKFAFFFEQGQEKIYKIHEKEQIQQLSPNKANTQMVNLSNLKNQNSPLVKQPQKLQALTVKQQGDTQIPNKEQHTSQPLKVQSISQQELSPLIIPISEVPQPQNEQVSNTAAFEQSANQQIDLNTIPVSNIYSLGLQKIQQEESKNQNQNELPNSPETKPRITKANEEQEGSLISIPQKKENQGPNPEDKIEFVIEQYGIGTRYEGGKLNGMRHGKGKFFYKEGSYYDGQWRHNKMHGIGVLYYPNGTVAYTGEWKDDEFDGNGTVYNDQQVKLHGTFDFTDFNKLDEEWIKYEGELKHDAKEGIGKLYLTNGQVYEGQFYKDTVHGTGVFKSNKTERKGVWQFGKLKKLL